jgi:hypothetical protein
MSDKNFKVKNGLTIQGSTIDTIITADESGGILVGGLAITSPSAMSKWAVINNLGINTTYAGTSATQTVFTVAEAGNYVFQVIASSTQGNVTNLAFSGELLINGSTMGNQFSTFAVSPYIFSGSPARIYGMTVMGTQASCAIGDIIQLRIEILGAGSGSTFYWSSRGIVNKVPILT